MSDYTLLWQDKDVLGDIRVLEDEQYRLLSFGDNDEQSKQLKSAPHVPQHTYIQAMLLSLMFTNPRSAIILGLGGGSMVHALRHYDAGLKLTAVELRPVVIAAAQKYFRVQASKKLQLIEDDALNFLTCSDHKRVDLIFADIYTNEGVDENQLSQAFINGALRLLKADGMLVLNCWKEHSRDMALLARLQASFAEVYACLTSGSNWVIFAARKPGTLKTEGLKTAIEELSARMHYQATRSMSRFGPWE